MSKKLSKLPPGVQLVSLKKCTLAFFLDMAFTVILMVSLYYSVGVNVILPASDYSALQKANENLYRESELVEERNNDGQFYHCAYKDTVDTPEADYAYKKYINLVWDYFIDKVPNNHNLSADVSFSYVGTDNESHRLEGFQGEAKARAEKAEEPSADEEPADEEAEKAALKDLAALEGFTEEEAAALANEESDEAVENLAKPQENAVEDSTDGGSDDADGFTDGGK